MQLGSYIRQGLYPASRRAPAFHRFFPCSGAVEIEFQGEETGSLVFGNAGAIVRVAACPGAISGVYWRATKPEASSSHAQGLSLACEGGGTAVADTKSPPPPHDQSVSCARNGDAAAMLASFYVWSTPRYMTGFQPHLCRS